MGTTLTEQITSIQESRKHVEYDQNWNVWHKKRVTDALNDAASTIAALKMAVATYKKAKENTALGSANHCGLFAEEFFEVIISHDKSES